MSARANEPGQVHANSKRIAVELERNAAAKIEFKIKIANWFVIDACVVPIVAHESRSARRDAAGSVTVAVTAAAVSAAIRRTATKYPADYRLISPRRNVVSRDRETKVARIVFDTAIELRVVAVRCKGPVKVPCVQNGVADTGVHKWREISERVIEVVRFIPSRVADTESFFLVAGRSCKVNGGTIVQGFIGIIPSQIGEETADANAGSGTRIIGG